MSAFAESQFLEQCAELARADRHERWLRVIDMSVPLLRCLYCGTHTPGRNTCLGHRDLVAADPFYTLHGNDDGPAALAVGADATGPDRR